MRKIQECCSEVREERRELWPRVPWGPLADVVQYHVKVETKTIKCPEIFMQFFLLSLRCERE